jgi:hypothetical protein
LRVYLEGLVELGDDRLEFGDREDGGGASSEIDGMDGLPVEIVFTLDDFLFQGFQVISLAFERGHGVEAAVGAFGFTERNV